MSRAIHHPAFEYPSSGASPWYLSVHFRRVLVAAGLIFLSVEAAVTMALRTSGNDFAGHVAQGEVALRQGLAAVHWDWYPLGRIAFNSVLAWTTLIGARILCFGGAIAATLWCWSKWQAMWPSRPGASPAAAFTAMGMAVVAAFTLVQRDLDECGLHLLLMFFLTAAAWGLYQARPALSGWWLAAAITFKSTPLLFLPFLLWKRQWRATAWTMLFIGVLNFAPALFFGWHATMDYHRRWWDSAIRSAALRDPTENIVEPPKALNQSWNTFVARLVMTYPPDHPLVVEQNGHPLFRQFGDLDVDAARWVVKGATLILLGVVAWRTRRRWTERDPRIGPEWTAVAILAILLSPFCWKQHLVVGLPAVFWACDELIRRGWRPRWQLALVVGFAALTLFSARGVLGRDLAHIALSYKVFTIAGLLMLTMSLTLGTHRQPSHESTPR